MDDLREKVIKGLECCRRGFCFSCPYNDGVDENVECKQRWADDAISLLKAQEEEIKQLKAIVKTECVRATIDHMPTVDAIPIDKLCDWLTEIDMPLADACPLIEKYHTCIQCDFFQRPIKDCWKEILSKLMEEQNENK